jgi:hypothetical protein
MWQVKILKKIAILHTNVNFQLYSDLFDNQYDIHVSKLFRK